MALHDSVPLEYGGCRLSPPRDFQTHEIALIERLMSFGTSIIKGHFPNDYSAQDYVDNLPGSIHILVKSTSESDRTLGGEIINGSFTDSDGTDVSIMLVVDDASYLYDLDIWKVNDEAIRAWPSIERIEQEQ